MRPIRPLRVAADGARTNARSGGCPLYPKSRTHLFSVATATRHLSFRSRKSFQSRQRSDELIADPRRPSVDAGDLAHSLRNPSKRASQSSDASLSQPQHPQGFVVRSGLSSRATGPYASGGFPASFLSQSSGASPTERIKPASNGCRPIASPNGSIARVESGRTRTVLPGVDPLVWILDVRQDRAAQVPARHRKTGPDGIAPFPNRVPDGPT